jgi:hypothetical protein
VIDRTIQKKPRRTQSARRFIVSAFFALSAVFSFSCGKKGPPLAPLIKLPVPPADLVAARRGDTVDLSFTVPGVNTDGSRPANVATADVYAITAVPTVPPLSDAGLLKYGTKVGTVAVKAPRDPNHTADEDDPSDEVDAPEGPGLDQGAIARLKEPLTREMQTPIVVPPDKNAPPAPAVTRTDGPLLGPPPGGPVRTYATFGISTKGRKGPLSKRVIVPLVPPPPPPSDQVITYDESAITLAWRAAGSAAPAGDDGLLPSRGLQAAAPAITYNVYDTSNAEAPLRLTDKPIDATKYSDNRIVFGEKRCYSVVATEAIAGATIESEPPPSTCVTPVDTFPPAAPKELKAISSEGAINLIWEPNSEPDVAGYLVLRGVEPAETLQQITPQPIAEPSFKDEVKPGVPYVYAVKAVDKAGNVSPISTRVVETAR